MKIKTTLKSLGLCITIIIVILAFVFVYFNYQKSNNMEKNISIAQAEKIAQEFFKENNGSRTENYIIDQSKTYKGNFGYVFFFESEEYIKTGDVSKLVPGLGEVVVENSGKTFFLSSSITPDMAIKELEHRFEQTNK